MNAAPFGVLLFALLLAALLAGGCAGPAGTSLPGDFERLRATIEETHPAPDRQFPPEVRARAAERTLRALQSATTPEEFHRIVAPFVAAFGDGHTTLQPPPRERFFPWPQPHAFPAVVDFSDAPRVAWVPRGSLLRVGDRLASVQGLSAEAWRDELLAFVPGEDARYRRAALTRRLPELLREAPARWQISVERDGTTLPLVVPALGEDAWRGALRRGGVTGQPWALWFPAPGAAVLRLRELAPAGECAPFVDAAFRRLRVRGTERLVLDLRDNPGGDTEAICAIVRHIARRPFRFSSRVEYRASPALLARFPLDVAPGTWVRDERGSAPCDPLPESERFRGRVLVLVNAGTYSAAAKLAATLQDEGLATVLGEATGGWPTGPAIVHRFRLPHTGLRATVATQWHVRASGAEIPGPVQPDLLVEEDLAARLRGEDAALRRAMELP